MKTVNLVTCMTEIESGLETLSSEMKRMIVLDTWDGWDVWDRVYDKVKLVRRTAQDDHASEFYTKPTGARWAVDEIIQEENSQKELARLKEEVEIKQRLTELLDVCEMQQNEIARLKAESSAGLRFRRQTSKTVMAMCRLLSGASDEDHKTKNQVIMRVVANLIAMIEPPNTQAARDMDDIPF